MDFYFCLSLWITGFDINIFGTACQAVKRFLVLMKPRSFIFGIFGRAVRAEQKERSRIEFFLLKKKHPINQSIIREVQTRVHINTAIIHLGTFALWGRASIVVLILNRAPRRTNGMSIIIWNATELLKKKRVLVVILQELYERCVAHNNNG